VDRNNFEDIPDALWRRIEPLIPPEKPKPYGGRPRVDDRLIMAGILFRLRTGCQWQALPKDFGSGPTCHRRFQQWERAGVFVRIYRELVRYYDGRRGIQWAWTSLDSATVKAPKGGTTPVPTRRTVRKAG
jgi:putative transposase